MSRRTTITVRRRGWDRLVEIEDQLEHDLRRFTAERPLSWNLAYVEGFEALTCAMALTAAERLAVAPDPAPRGPESATAGDPAPVTGEPQGDKPPRGQWAELWAWHLCEEIEHRTVAFDVHEQVHGRWAHRVAVSLWAQAHLRRHLARFHQVLMAHHGERTTRPYLPVLVRRSWRRQIRTYSPGYDPGRLEVPPIVGTILAGV